MRRPFPSPFQPEQNAPCLCGSGFKFKQCCLPGIPRKVLWSQAQAAMAAGKFDDAIIECRADITQHTIMNYPLPDHQTGQKFSAFTYLHLDANRPVCGTVHNVSSPEMLYCSSSSGEHFDKRARELRQSPNIVEGIIAHANKPE